MLTFDDVYRAPLDKMKAAADDWAEMKTKLDRLAEDARTTMAAKAKDDYWRGVNAEVTKPFVDKTAKEFADAAKEADGIHKILHEGYNAFKKAQDDLKKIIDAEAPAQGMVVMADGHVEARKSVTLIEDSEVRNDPDYPDLVRREREAIRAMQLRVDAVIETCDDADEACSNALKANVTGDTHNFSAPKYGSLDAEEAQRVLALAKKGADLSHSELERLNELLQDNHGSKEFARTFYDGLGPKGALEFYARLSTDTYRENTLALDPQRLKDVQDLQRNLGLNLATATQGDDQWAERWSTEMRKLGTQHVPLVRNDNSAPFGYQLLGGIMRYGDYNPKFLLPITEHVAQLHAKEPYLFMPDRPVIGAWVQSQYNPSGINGYGFDPMTSMLEALGHSPEAAKEFFSADPTSYNRDGSVGGTLDLGKDKDGKAIENYIDFFANEKYAFLHDSNGKTPDEEAAGYMPDAFGHALEAATLGHAWDDPDPRLKRDETTAGIMQQVVEKYGDAELLKKQSTMADSLGNMAAGYIDDINWALADGDADSVFKPNESRLAHPEFGQRHAIDFLSALGQHPDAYATVSTAERLHTTSVLEAQFGSDGRINEAHARDAARTGATLQGILDEARAAQVEAEGIKAHEDYEKELEKKAAWVELGASTAVAAGVAFLPITAPAAGLGAVLVPLAVDTGSGAMEQMASQVIGDWTEKSADERKDATDAQIHADKKSLYEAGRISAEAPVDRFLAQHRSEVSGKFRQDLIESVDLGYAKGNDQTKQTGNAPVTE